MKVVARALASPQLWGSQRSGRRVGLGYSYSWWLRLSSRPPWHFFPIQKRPVEASTVSLPCTLGSPRVSILLWTLTLGRPIQHQLCSEWGWTDALYLIFCRCVTPSLFRAKTPNSSASWEINWTLGEALSTPCSPTGHPPLRPAFFSLMLLCS